MMQRLDYRPWSLLLLATIWMDGTCQAEEWSNPIRKQGYLESPLVEVTPLSLEGKLYLMECWRSQWEWEGSPAPSVAERSEIWIAYLPEGPSRYDKREYIGRPLVDCTLGTALIWDERVYVFAAKAVSSGGGREVFATSSNDLKSWSEPVEVFQSPALEIFNVAVTRDARGMAFLWETNGVGTPFTMCYGRVKNPTDLWNAGVLAGACYGTDKYTGGPALYFHDDWYYTLYLESLGNGRYETRVTRSKDLKVWHDAPANRPFVTFDPKKKGLPLRPKDKVETNASDVELCYHQGQTLIYFTGGDQQVGGDLQWATFDGTPAELLAIFFE